MNNECKNVLETLTKIDLTDDAIRYLVKFVGEVVNEQLDGKLIITIDEKDNISIKSKLTIPEARFLLQQLAGNESNN